MKKLFFTIVAIALWNAGFAQQDTTQKSNRCANKFKEQLQFTATQSAQLDSIFALHSHQAGEADSVPPLCLKAKDEEIVSLLTPDQRAKYEMLKQEWKEQKASVAAKLQTDASPVKSAETASKKTDKPAPAKKK
ncbi:hypothetical protein FACS189456_5380 [Bacteroidia bacterium]|nr:hypothetical protein FACS189456_5380 [Bacteroidia bacterium]